MFLYIKLHFPFTSPGNQWIQIPCSSLFVPSPILCPSQTIKVCGGISIQVICRYYKWGKSLGVLICRTFTTQDYLFKGGRRGLAAWLANFNSYLLAQILWQMLSLSWWVSHLCTDEGRTRGQGLVASNNIALECKVNKKWGKRKGRESPWAVSGDLSLWGCLFDLHGHRYQLLAHLWSSGSWFLMWHVKNQRHEHGARALCPPVGRAQSLMGHYSHPSTARGNKTISPWTLQVLLNMCFGSRPTRAPLFYHCLFLSFPVFISRPNQTCEHCEGWVTQTGLLSAVKSIIRQQNPLASLLFRVPTLALKEKGTSERNFGNYPLPSVPQMLFCRIEVPVDTWKERSELPAP